jgi:hypothetical protein
LAWIGYSENDPEKTVRPVAKAGRSLDFLDQVKISWGESETRQDPAGTAIRTSKSYWINDIQADPKDSLWRSAAIAQGFGSCIALPLIAHDKQLGAVDLRGALSLYPAEPEAFDDSAIEYYAELAMCLTHAVAVLRGDLAGDLAYDVAALRAAEERRRSEDALRLARTELARVMQMTAASQVAASIAHEINQPLAAIVTSGSAGLRWLARSTPDLDEARAALEYIVEAGHHASEVIDGIRAMFKKDWQVEAPLDVNQLIREVFALLQGEIRNQQVSIRIELAEELPPVPANRAQLQQVVVNLIMNAVDAMSTVANRVRSLRVKTEMQRIRLFADHGARLWHGDRCGKYRPYLRGVLHDEIPRHGHGAVHLPVDCGTPWWAPVGVSRSAPWIDLSRIAADPQRRCGTMTVRMRLSDLTLRQEMGVARLNS